MASVDPKDSTNMDVEVPDYEKLLGGGIRVCAWASRRISHRRRSREIDALWSKGAEWLKAQGAQNRGSLAATHQYALPTIISWRRGSLSNWRATMGSSSLSRAGRPRHTDLYERSRAKDSVRKCSAAS